MSKPTLIIVTPGFPTNEQDTSCLPAFQQFVLSLKTQFPQNNLMVISFQYPFEKKEYTWNGISVIALGGKNRSKLFRVMIWLKAYQVLSRIKKQHSIMGIVSLWATECALVANTFAKKNKLKHLIWIIGQDAKVTNKYIALIKPEPGQLMAMSDFLKDEFFKNHHITPGFVVENGIKESVFPEFNINERPIDIFGAGSLIPLKNYSLFIELIAEVKLIFPDIQAAIAGGGEEKNKLQDLINKYDLSKTITLLGAKTHAETLDLMNAGKLFLHTSFYEGNSTVLMEALYSGCKVISTCPLSHQTTENLFIEREHTRLKEKILKLLSQNSSVQKRVVFNTMDRSAQRIVDLLLQ